MPPSPQCGIAAVISAYRAQDTIGECLQSLLSQQLAPEEIVVGVDGCPDTAKFLAETAFSRSVKVYDFQGNNGPYLVFNTLVPLTSAPLILFFGADDAAYPWMTLEVAHALVGGPKSADIVSLVSHDNIPCRGAMCLTRDAWSRLGSFEPWRCAADWEMQVRAARNGMTLVSTARPVFRRNVSPACLSAVGNADTGEGSELRKGYHKLGRSSVKFNVETTVLPCKPLAIAPTAVKWPATPRMPTLGVSMIVRDEEACLERCLRSVSGADEIVAVDTGSKDATPDIARKYTDKVFVGEYAWKDEYDDARNFAMAKCSSDWLISIDADEELEPGGIERIRKLIAAAPPHHLAFGLRMVAATGNHEHSLVRLWRNRCGLKFNYVGHEVLSRVADVNLGITIKYGYSEAHKGDPDRMLRILMKGLQRSPECPRYLFYVAREHVYRRDWPRAIEFYRRYLAVGKWAPELAEAHLQLSRCCGEMKDWDGAKTHALRAVMINADFRDGLLRMAELCGPNNAAKWREYAKLAADKDVLFRRS